MSKGIFFCKGSLPAEIADELAKCTRCNLCLSVCPPYDLIKEEHVSPRGIIAVIKNKSPLEVPDKIVNGCLITCSGKAICASECPTGVDFIKFVNYFSNEKKSS